MSGKAEITSYDSISSRYIAHVERDLSWNNIYERPQMLSMFAPFTGKDVLDAGCGTGFYSAYAAGQGARVRAVDASQEMLDYAAAKNASDNISYTRADLAGGFPFLANSSQDYIISSLSIHYLEDWEFFLAECHRVLRKEGMMYISTHHPFADYLFFNKKSYFYCGWVDDVWGHEDNRFKVHFYTRTLEQVMGQIINSPMFLEKLHEPLPNENCRKKCPEIYEKLSTTPSFLFLTLKK